MRTCAYEAKISNIYFATWSVTSPPDTFARKRFASTKVISLVSLPLIDNTESPNLRFAFSARLFSFTYDGTNVLMNYKQVLSGVGRAPGALSNAQTFGIFGDAWNFMANLKRLKALRIATFNHLVHLQCLKWPVENLILEPFRVKALLKNHALQPTERFSNFWHH